MKHLAIISLAGLLIACASIDSSSVAQEAQECHGSQCFVSITVVDGKIEASPNNLGVNGDEVTIHFRLMTNGYNFISDTAKAIEFKEKSKKKAAKYFSQPFRGKQKNIVMFDFNASHIKGEFEYSIRVIPSGGGDTIELDPIIINR